MQPVTSIHGIAAPLMEANIDTDIIIPKQFLRTIQRSGLGKNAFNDRRYAADGQPLPNFILNQPPYNQAKILVTGENFGCGSSREHAPWALTDFGMQAIIAPSFADIFFNNAGKNGLLLITLPAAQVDQLVQDASDPAARELMIDLPAQTITRANGEIIGFTMDPFRKHCLVNGLDDIGLTLAHTDKIDAFEAQQRASQPWLWAKG